VSGFLYLATEIVIMQPHPFTAEQIEAEHQRYMVKVYAWIGVGMVVTGLVAMFTAASTLLQDIILGSSWVFFGLIILQLVAVTVLIEVINRITASMATVIFFIYAVVNGLSLSSIYVVYTEESIASTFFITALVFGIMSAYGHFTKQDLTRLGNLSVMALVALLVTTLINLLLNSPLLDWITTCIGITIFVGLTAYDAQKIKATNIIGNEGTDDDHKEAIMGALTLYLDFINLFLYLLRVFGRRK